MVEERRTGLAVGVTGTRVMPTTLADRLRPRVASVLALISDIPGHDGVPSIVSPLAEGADRLVAEEALRLGYALLAPLPFPQAEYERDFAGSPTDSLDVFRRLLSRANKIVELDGTRGATEAESYEAVGHYVVRSCRLLIAVWDGETTGKRGGTAEITLFAARTGVPIYWVPADGQRSPRWIDGEDGWQGRHTMPHEDADAALVAYLRAR